MVPRECIPSRYKLPDRKKPNSVSQVCAGWAPGLRACTREGFLTTILQDGYPHWTGREMEVHRDEIICPSSHRQEEPANTFQMMADLPGALSLRHPGPAPLPLLCVSS